MCEQFYPELPVSNISDFNQILNHHSSFIPTSPYYMYLETKELEDLQAFKNCVDYMMCGTYEESIVDDPKNYRMHIWKNMTGLQLTDLIRSCPVKDLAKKLVVRYGSQTGKIVTLKNLNPDPAKQKSLSKRSSPAIYHEPSAETSKKVVEAVRSLLKTNKIEAAHKLILSTWNIDLHGYALKYTGEKGSYAVTFHGQKVIKYGKDWLTEPCDYIRMIRHEAEHVAQMQMARSCFTHNFNDHKKRERAAHLNDARFIKNVCGTLKAGDTVRKFCLERFRNNYMTAK